MLTSLLSRWIERVRFLLGAMSFRDRGQNLFCAAAPRELIGQCLHMVPKHWVFAKALRPNCGSKVQDARSCPNLQFEGHFSP